MTHPLDEAPNVAAAFLNHAAQHPDAPLYWYASPPTSGSAEERWHRRTRGEVAKRVGKLAHSFLSLGCRKGVQVAILSGTRPEWSEVDLAILATGATVVTLYHSLTAHEIGYILHDAGVSIVVAEDQEQLEKLHQLMKSPCPIPAREGQPAKQVQISLRRIIAIEQVDHHPLVVQLDDILADPDMPALPIETHEPLGRSDLASLVYTSGTTGPPKGVMQTHGNFLANVRQAEESGMFAKDGSIFLFLPLAHSFARLISHIGFLTGATLKFATVPPPGITKAEASTLLMRDMREANADVVPSVPRIFEKVMEGIRNRARVGKFGGLILSLTLRHAARHYRAEASRKAPGIWTSIVYAGTEKIRAKFRPALFGSNFKHAISGGAKLPVHVNEFFGGLGIRIYEGYGLTETCVATHVNRHDRNRIGSVGPALHDVQVRISPTDGEILMKGPNISRGYYNRPDATRAAWDEEGWFHTGDVGHIDGDGFLFITGRKKELIVTAGGKKIAPLEIEGLMLRSAYISQAVLVGDGKPYCVALITLNEGAVRQWGEQHKLDPKADLASSQAVQDLIWKEIERTNEELPSYSTIKKVRILPHDLTLENGLLTPTLKVRRGLVVEQFKELVAEMYR